MTETTPSGPAGGTTAAGTCQWPYEDGRQCIRTPERKGSRGPAPLYCGQADDGPRQPVHSALNAYRAKTRAGTSPQGEDPDAGRAPVTDAIATAAGILDRAEVLGAGLREALEHFTERLQVAGNPDDAAAQIAAQVADAEERAGVAQAALSREKAARLTAETQAGESASLAEQMASQAEDALTDAERANTGARQAREDLEAETADHRAELARIREEAAQEIRAVRAAAAAEVTTAGRAAAAARDEAAQAHQDAAREVAQARDDAARQVSGIREDAARERTELHEAFQASTATLQGALDAARADLRQQAQRADADRQQATAELAAARQQATQAQASLTHLRAAAAAALATVEKAPPYRQSLALREAAAGLRGVVEPSVTASRRPRARRAGADERAADD